MNEQRPSAEAVERILKGWRYFGHPIRPGPAEVAAVEKGIAGIDRPRVLALGATPELIDLAIGLDARRVTAIDWNGNAAEAMRRLAGRDWSGVEMIIADWRERREELAASFDAAVGDGTFTFMGFPDDWRLLFGILRDYIVPGGVVVTRETFRTRERFDFTRRAEEATARFDENGRDLPPEKRLFVFRDMLAYLRMGSVIAAADGTGVVDIAKRRSMCDQLGVELARRYPEGDMAQAVDAIFGKLAKARPIEAVSTASMEEARGVIEEFGFRLESCEPLGDLPLPGAVRSMVVRREED